MESKVERIDGKVALITGANAGIGKEVARQLVLSGAYKTIHLACRNPSKATTAKKELEAATGTAIFEVVLMDVSDPASVRAALSSLHEPIDDLVMNAGGAGGKTPLALTKDGVTEIFVQRPGARRVARWIDRGRQVGKGRSLRRERSGARLPAAGDEATDPGDVLGR